MATGRDRPAPPRVTPSYKRREPAPPYYITHKTQAALIAGGVILGLLFIIDLLAGIVVKFI